MLDGLLTSITYARMFLRLQDGDDLHGLYLKAAREPYTDFTSWIEAIEENVTLLCDLVPTIQSIVNEACELQISDTPATNPYQWAEHQLPDNKTAAYELRSSFSSVDKSPGAVTTRPEATIFIKDYLEEVWKYKRAEQDSTLTHNLIAKKSFVTLKYPPKHIQFKSIWLKDASGRGYKSSEAVLLAWKFPSNPMVHRSEFYIVEALPEDVDVLLGKDSHAIDENLNAEQRGSPCKCSLRCTNICH